MKNKYGFGIIENLIAMFVITIFILASTSAIVFIRNQKSDINVINDEDKQALDLIENIRVGIQDQQPNYNPDATIDINNLSYKWGAQVPFGSYDYMIRPLSGKSGMYSVEVKLSHPKWGAKLKTYQFIVGTK
jgi:hypothetical protein